MVIFHRLHSLFLSHRVGGGSRLGDLMDKCHTMTLDQMVAHSGLVTPNCAFQVYDSPPLCTVQIKWANEEQVQGENYEAMLLSLK